MRLTKDGVTYELTNPVQIAAFVAAGYVEPEQPEQPEPAEEKPKRTRKTTSKAE